MPWQQNNSGGGQGPWGNPGGNQGGGSNGNGGRGQSPWGGGSNGSGPEDFVTRARRQAARRPGGSGGSGQGIGPLIALGGLALLVIWIALNSIYQVQPGEQAVVKRFGELNRVEGPGLQFKLPSPIESVAKVSVAQVRETTVGFSDNPRNANRSDSLMITGDQNIVDMRVNVQWRAARPEDYLFNVDDPVQTVQIAAESAVREIVGRTPIQDALSIGRERIEIATLELLQDTLNQYQAGIDIDEVQLQNVQPPQEVKQAFDDVQSAQQDRDKAANKAEAYRNQRIPEARGESERIRNGALSYFERETKRAQGEAQRFIELLSAYRENPEITRERIFLDTMQEVYGNGRTLIIDGNNGANALPFLPLPGLTDQTR